MDTAQERCNDLIIAAKALIPGRVTSVLFWPIFQLQGLAEGSLMINPELSHSQQNNNKRWPRFTPTKFSAT